MSDHREYSHESWFEHLGTALKRSIAGIFLVILSFYLLIWNEERSVLRHQAIKEGAGVAISVRSNQVLSDNNGKLIHTSGQLKVFDQLTDPVFNVSVAAIKMSRDVVMYQWVQEIITRTETAQDGGEYTITDYNYKKKWVNKLVDSSSFKKKNHENPTEIPFQSQLFLADKVNLGDFSLSEKFYKKLKHYESFKAESIEPLALNERMKQYDGGYYIGENPLSPAIGDVKISFHIVKPTIISVIGEQRNNLLVPYSTSSGESLALLEYGTVSMDKMFTIAEQENIALTWLARFGGFILMTFGFLASFYIFEVITRVLPFFGRLVNAGLLILSVFLSASLSIITIALGWIAHRPIIAYSLIAVAVLFLVFSIFKVMKASPDIDDD